MSKKHKGAARTAKKSAKKALRTVAKHGPLSAALVTIGGVVSSVLTSEKIQTALQELVSGVIGRAGAGLARVKSKASEALPALREDSDEHAHA